MARETQGIGTQARRRNGFTILELLVVTAIIGVLIGILLPALMAARESARRLQCTSNLHEVGLAVAQHHEGAKRLPAAWKNAADRVSGYGWAVALLPYLEQADLQRSLNCRLPVAAAENERPRSTDLPIMRCPSDISEPLFDLAAERAHPPGDHATLSGSRSASLEPELLVRLPSANYVGVYGTLEADESYPAPAGDGPIISDRNIRFADLERGQSHTLLVGERTAAMVPSTWLGVNFRGEDAACRLVGSAMTTPSCDACDECEFGSRHSGGSNFVWADGHVGLLESDIDPAAYRQLARRRTN
jgi:prepilin-type N-terminal cleavage/methylation domain-containing protein/prepilin-type processing-associated H-X9-DG protein